MPWCTCPAASYANPQQEPILIKPHGEPHFLLSPTNPQRAPSIEAEGATPVLPASMGPATPSHCQCLGLPSSNKNSYPSRAKFSLFQDVQLFQISCSSGCTASQILPSIGRTRCSKPGVGWTWLPRLFSKSHLLH